MFDRGKSVWGGVIVGYWFDFEWVWGDGGFGDGFGYFGFEKSVGECLEVFSK